MFETLRLTERCLVFFAQKRDDGLDKRWYFPGSHCAIRDLFQ